MSVDSPNSNADKKPDSEADPSANDESDRRVKGAESPEFHDLRESNRKRRDRLMVAFTGVIAFASIVQAITVGLQWQAMRQSNEGSQRAWLIAEATSPPLMQHDLGFSIAIRITNTGGSPAYNIQSVVGASVFPGSIPATLDTWKDSWDPGEHPYRDVVGNKGYSLIPGEMGAFTKQQLADINAARSFYTIYALIVYDDTLGTRRVTRYCQFWDLRISPPGWRFCPVHNSIR